MKIKLVYRKNNRTYLQTLLFNCNEKIIARDAIIAAKISVDFNINKIGIFGQIISPEHELKNGDRLEIYRPLLNDPKEIRKKRLMKR